MCGGLETSFFFFFFFHLLGTAFTRGQACLELSQEISKCLCLERQVAGTHSKASSASRTTENRASPSEKFQKPRLTTEGRDGQPGGSRPPGESLPVTLGGLTHQAARRTAGNQFNWLSLDFFLYEVRLIEPALKGIFRI